MKNRVILILISMVILTSVLGKGIDGVADSKENKATITILPTETEQTTVSTDKNDSSQPVESGSTINREFEANKKERLTFPKTNTSESSNVLLLMGLLVLINLYGLYYYNKRNEEKKNETN